MGGEKGFVFGTFQWPTTKAVILTEKPKFKNQKHSTNTKTQDKLDVYVGQMFVDSCPGNKLINMQFIELA